MSWEHSLENWSIEGSGFTLPSVYCIKLTTGKTDNLSKVTNVWRVLSGRSVCKKQFKASIVFEEFYGLES